MAAIPRAPYAARNNKRRINIRRAQSLLMHDTDRPLIAPKQRASSLQREQSLKEASDQIQRSLGIDSPAPVEMFRGQRSKKRSSVVAVTDSSFARPSSPLLGFRSPPQSRRRMMHAKSCDMTPLRVKIHMQLEADLESQSSDESCNLAPANLNQANPCQISQLSCSPTSQRRKVWSLEHNAALHTPPDTADSSTASSRSGSPATQPMEPPFPSPSTPDFHLLRMPKISVSAATPPLTPRQAALRLKMIHNMRICHSTSALFYSTGQINHREPILHELIKTERRYISNLDTLLNTLLPAIEDAVAPRDLRLLFPCQLEPLLEWHKQLLTQLEDQMESDYGMVGDVFRQICSGEAGNSEFFNMYSAYMNEFRVAMQTLAKYEHSSQSFRQEVRSCQQLAECEGLTLSAFLLTPVQRLPRYELLLKDLLKHTPMEHSDHYYLQEAVDLLREELQRLNASIKSCELACSVTRIRNGRRSASIRRLGSKGRMAGRQLAKLMKHLSTNSVEDLSNISDNHSSPEMPHPTVLSRKKTHSVQEIRNSSLYRSEENLPVLQESAREQELRRSLGTIERTSSCIDLAVDYEQHPEMKRYSQPVCTLETLESLPCSPVAISPAFPLLQSETDDSLAQSNSRASVYSTASSTSGIGSSNSQSELHMDLDSTLTLTPSSPSSPLSPLPLPIATSLDITPTNHLPTSASGHTTVTVATPHQPVIMSPSSPVTASSTSHTRWKKRMSWAGSFVMPLMRKKKSTPDVATTSTRCSSSRDIGLPTDFRHIQHGFIATSSPKPVS